MFASKTVGLNKSHLYILYVLTENTNTNTKNHIVCLGCGKMFENVKFYIPISSPAKSALYLSSEQWWHQGIEVGEDNDAHLLQTNT